MLHPKIKSLLGGSMLWYFGEGMLGPLFAVFTERIGGDIFNITWAWALYLITLGTTTMIVGWLSDGRVNKERMLIAGYVLNTACTFGYLWVDSPLRLMVLQFGLGIASALATPTWQALFAKYADRKRDGYAWGLAQGTSELMRGIAILVAGIIVTRFSFTTLFLTMGVLQIFATMYQLRIVSE